MLSEKLKYFRKEYTFNEYQQGYYRDMLRDTLAETQAQREERELAELQNTQNLMSVGELALKGTNAYDTWQSQNVAEMFKDKLVIDPKLVQVGEEMTMLPGGEVSKYAYTDQYTNAPFWKKPFMPSNERLMITPEWQAAQGGDHALQYVPEAITDPATGAVTGYTTAPDISTMTDASGNLLYENQALPGAGQGGIGGMYDKAKSFTGSVVDKTGDVLSTVTPWDDAALTKSVKGGIQSGVKAIGSEFGGAAGEIMDAAGVVKDYGANVLGTGMNKLGQIPGMDKLGNVAKSGVDLVGKATGGAVDLAAKGAEAGYKSLAGGTLGKVAGGVGAAMSAVDLAQNWDVYDTEEKLQRGLQTVGGALMLTGIGAPIGLAMSIGGTLWDALDN